MVNNADISFGEDNSINIRGARQHNLKNIDLSLPRKIHSFYRCEWKW